MELIKHTLIVINIFTCTLTSDINVEDKYPVNRTNINYTGEKFPIQYFFPDNAVPSKKDLNRYLLYLQQPLAYFAKFLNATDCNAAFASYVTKSMLKKTLRDSRSKLEDYHITFIKSLINKAENIVSHYNYRHASHDWDDDNYKLTIILKTDDIFVNNIANFNRNLLRSWVLSNEYMHDFIEEMDNGTLPRDKFVEIVNDMQKYFIGLHESDECITRVAKIGEPLDVSTLQPCPADDYCKHHISSEPSAAYALSHRMLNLLIRLKTRNCYIESEQDDLKHIEKLCAFMYRETVYIARRGYFLRDLFLEHITLCAMLGYEEFHRLKWFNKATSWVNKYGCVKEFYNFEFNRTKMIRSEFDNDVLGETKYLTYRCEMLKSVCDDHPTALVMSALSHAIRYTAHYMQSS